MKLGLDRAVLQSMSTPKETAVSVCMLHNVCMCVCPNVLVSVHVCACMVLCVHVCERQLGGRAGEGRGGKGDTFIQSTNLLSLKGATDEQETD